MSAIYDTYIRLTNLSITTNEESILPDASVHFLLKVNKLIFFSMMAMNFCLQLTTAQQRYSTVCRVSDCYSTESCKSTINLLSSSWATCVYISIIPQLAYIVQAEIICTK